MDTPVFYSGTKNASSWAMRAWLALRAADFDFTEQVVDIRRPQRFRGLTWLGSFSPSATVPALVVEHTTIFDSIAIMEFANDVASGRLLPDNVLARAKARSVVAWQHSGLSGICSRISFESSFYPLKRRLTPSEIAECNRLFAFIDQALATSDGPFLFGCVSLADFALTPTVIRLSRHNAPTQAFPLAARWMRRVIDHPLVAEWLTEADALPHVWLEDYLAPDEPWNEAFEHDALHDR